MQGQYGPQVMLNQFTSATTQTAMNNEGANRRTDAQIQSSNYQAGLQRDMMNKQFSLTHALNVGNQQLAAESQQWGQQKDKFIMDKDVATYNQGLKKDEALIKSQDSIAAAAAKDAETKRILALRPNLDRVRKEGEADKAGAVNWSLWNEEANTVTQQLDAHIAKLDATKTPGIANLQDLEKTNKIEQARAKYRRIKESYGNRIKWAQQQYEKHGAGFLPSFFQSNLGNIKALRQLAELGSDGGEGGGVDF